MSTTISIRIDEDVKKSAQSVASSLGLSLSALVNIYLRQIAISRRIELYAPEPANPKLEKVIASVEAEIAAGEVSEGTESVEEFLAELKS